jgi:hypothetical protein
MKYTERPAWMAPSRRKPAKAPEAVSMSLTQGTPPGSGTGATGYSSSGDGYNPYDTVNTRAADIWRFKPKRS